MTEIVITGRYEFLGADTQGTTNLPLPIEQVPQSISLVSADFIKAADLKTLGDIASYTPGAVSAGNPENNGTVINLRGFAAGRAIDGINTIGTYNSFEPDFVVYDRLEVVQGPSSVVYGVSSPGGLVNYVTKSATSQTPSYLSAQGGSWNSYRFEGQIAHTLESNNRIRLIGIAAVDNGNSFTNDLYHRETVIYGGIDAGLSDSVNGYLHAGYERYKRPAFDGILTEPDGSPAPVPHSFFMGSPNIVLDTKTYFASGNLHWQPNPVLEVDLKANYEDAGLTGGNSYASSLQTNGDFTFNVTKFDGTQSTRNYGVGLSSIIHFDTLGLKDSFLSLAALYQDSRQDTNVLYPADLGTANIFGGQEAVYQAFNALYAGPLPYSYPSVIDAKTTTFSAQSVTKFADRLTALVGVSYSKPKVDTTTYGIAQNFDFPGQTSWRAGLTYELAHGANAYFSYSESFTPQAFLNVQQNVLPPVTGEQYEAGVKYRVSSHLLLTGALFRIVENNLATYDTYIGGVDYYKAIGEVTHKGASVQALGQINANWQVNGGYSYLDPTITADADPTAVGQEQLFLPKSTFSLYTTYALSNGALSGVTIGGGVRYVGSVKTSYTGATKDISDYTVADLTAAYNMGLWKVQLNVNNVFDKTYFINNYQTLDYGNYPGATRSFAISVTRTFR